MSEDKLSKLEFLSGDNKDIFQASPALSTDRTTAVKGAYEALSTLPIKRGLAIREALEAVAEVRVHYSILDMVAPLKARSKLMRRLAKPSDSQLLRQRLVEKNPDLLSAETRQEQEPMSALTAEEATAIPKMDLVSQLKEGTLDLRDLDLIISQEYGSVLFPAGLKMDESPFGKFFTACRRLGKKNQESGSIDLRGLNFLVAADRGKDMRGKFAIICEDLTDGLELVAKYYRNRGEIANHRDYLLYLGILDYLKMHSITTFHVLTFLERNLKFSQDVEYQYYKELSVIMMETFTKMYYQTLIGADYGEMVNLKTLQALIKPLTDYTTRLVTDELGGEPDPNQSKKERNDFRAKTMSLFKYPETFTPPMIALGALAAVSKYPDADIIVGIPSGGTEVAIVAKLIYELWEKRHKGVVCAPRLIFLPISVHSHARELTEERVAEFVNYHYPGLFTGKKVLLVDDNSSSGKTLKYVDYAVASQHAKERFAHISEFDPRRLLRDEYEDGYANPYAFPTTLDIYEIDDQGKEAHKRKVGEKIGLCRSQINRERQEL